MADRSIPSAAELLGLPATTATPMYDPRDSWLEKCRGDYEHVTWDDTQRCKGRGHGPTGPGVLITRNGVKQVTDHCLTCGTATSGYYRYDGDRDQLPVYRNNQRNQNACNHFYAEPAKVIAGDGRVTWRNVCHLCGVKLDHIPPPEGDVIYTVVDGRRDQDGYAIAPPCDRCGSFDGTQEHHWAPRAIFDDADKWPTAHLCVRCHRIWHQKVTPQVRRRNVA